MAAEIENWRTQMFSANVMTTLQQEGSRLMGAIKQFPVEGKAASIMNYVGQVTSEEVLSRFAPLTPQDPTRTRRWVHPKLYHVAPVLSGPSDRTLAPGFEVLGSDMVKNFAWELGRQVDREIIRAFFGTSYTGETGTGTATFDTSGQRVAVNFAAAGNVGLTLKKLVEAKRILMANQVNENERIFAVITSQQWQDLTNEYQLVNKDFTNTDFVSTGRLPPIAGINFIQTELLPATADPYRRVPVFAESAMGMGVWIPVTTTVSKRVDLSEQPDSLYSYMQIGATRLDEDRIVDILCNEA